MLNKVLVFLSEIIYNAWHKVISDLATPSPPLARLQHRAGLRAHTQIRIFAAVQRVCDLGARSTVTLKKN